MRIIQCAAFMALLITLPACSTMEGMGKDIQSLGKSLESASSPKAETPKPLEQPSGAVVTPIK